MKMPKEYSFLSHWEINAPLPLVWNTIYESELWPEWWKGVIAVKETNKGDEKGIGSIRIYTMRSPMLYTLSFNMQLTERIDYKLLKGNASGDLAGTGAWSFEEKNGKTVIQCHWNVHTTIWWMNTFAFLLKPLFSFNHGMVMRNGAKSLAKKLGTNINIIS